MARLPTDLSKGKTCSKCSTHFKVVADGFYLDRRGRPHGAKCKRCCIAAILANRTYDPAARSAEHRERYENDPVYREAVKRRARERAARLRATEEGRAAWNAKKEEWRRAHPEKKAEQNRRDKQWRAQAGWITRQKRERVLKHYGAICVACCSTEDLTVDHILPVSAGGTSDLSNLQVLCGMCNAKKGTNIIDYR